MPPPTADPAGTRDQIAETRPGLLDGYDTALPAARTAILARLLVATETEPLPGLTTRHHHDGHTHVRFGDTVLTYPTTAATPFTRPTPASPSPSAAAPPTTPPTSPPPSGPAPTWPPNSPTASPTSPSPTPPTPPPPGPPTPNPAKSNKPSSTATPYTPAAAPAPA
ncbi:hypothetical protein [Actinoplanes sp. CA-252034]|uniref:hypothetical protein n=1 Tax=Actinoplanes sp. CA-252034 TaxID=3239906 RepID=UPI003D9542F2